MYIKHVSLHRVRTCFFGLILAAATVFLLMYPAAAAAGISRGLSVCASVIIPTLFPFLVISGLTARSGVAAAIGRRLERPTRRLFGLPGCAAPAVLLACFGGYPAGGAAVADLVHTGQLTRDEGERMLRFCVCGGPGFILVTVGSRLMNSTPLGLILFAANLLSAFLIGTISAPHTARRGGSMTRRPAPVSIAEAFTQSVSAACQTLLNTCGFVTVFSTVLALLDACLPSSPALLSCLLEVSCGCIRAAALREAAPLVLGFTVGFGGLSVHCQIAAAFTGTGVITPRFWVFRFFHGALTALLTVLLLRIIPITIPVFGMAGGPVVEAFSGGVTVSVFTLILCGIWLLSVDKGNGVTYNKTHIST
ncbi:MAG: hypothetical protein IJP14_03980 [Clostridia bacterium]|nr:hypothetical protein [Clostridia bacterium]